MASTSTELWPRGGARRLPGTALLAGAEAARIARDLTEKYGCDALAFARGRAARAIEIGDDLALEAWQAVIEATQRLLR